MKNLYDDTKIVCPTCNTENNVEYLSCLPKNLVILDCLEISNLNSYTYNSEQLTLNKHPISISNKIITSKTCGLHYKNIEVYCEKDKTLLCITCILDSSHKNHTLTEINKVYTFVILIPI